MYLEISREEILFHISEEEILAYPYRSSSVGIALAEKLNMERFELVGFFGLGEKSDAYDIYYSSMLGVGIEKFLKKENKSMLLNPCKQVIP